MKDVRTTRKILACILCVSVWHLCSIAAFAGEVGTSAPVGSQIYSSPVAGLLSAGQSAIASGYRNLSVQPKGVSGSVGQVSWKSLSTDSPAWTCRTGSGGAATLDLKEAGRISISENSNVDVRLAGEDLVVTLVRGAVLLEGTAAARIRVETYEATYLLGDSSPFRTRFSWHSGSLAISGDPGRRIEGETASPALKVAGPTQPVRLAHGKASPLAVVVTDTLGEPVAGVPIVFSAPEGARVSFSGAPSAVALTNERGIAQTTAAVLGSGPVAIGAAVAGTTNSAAVQADVNRTTGKQKWMAAVILGALAAATIALVVVSRNEGNPVLTTGTPTRVAP